MTEGKSRPGYRDAVRVMLAVLIGMLAGGVFNASLGEQGAGHAGVRTDRRRTGARRCDRGAGSKARARGAGRLTNETRVRRRP